MREFSLLAALALAIGVTAAPRQPLVVDTVPAAFTTEIQGGLLYGTFQKSDCPLLIEGSIIVPSGQTLEFGPGCTIYVGGKYTTITVFGRIVAKGTKSEPVQFRSSRKDPHPWDWDRIYVRSRNRSVFEHCIVRHSNYGIVVENGAATIEHCLFERNSLTGIVAHHADLTITATRLQKGHVLSLLCRPGAVVRAESLVVIDNATGIACGERSTLRMTGGEIGHNTNGIVVMNGASVEIVGADIVGNAQGIVSLQEIPPKVREMVYGNKKDVRIVTNAEMEKLMKPPEDVRSVALPRMKADGADAGDFKPGFSAARAPREQEVSFMGNVSSGFKYFAPTSSGPLVQTRYPGEQEDSYFAGLQPEIQVFANGRRKGADVNMLIDMYGNEWIDLPLHLRKNTFNLSMNYLDQHLIVGDFFESHSETSIMSRKMTGVKYTGDFLPMGKGMKRLSFNLAGGESESPKDSGDHELDIYNDVVDSGMSARQQITYAAGIGVKPTIHSVVNVRGLILRDQTTNPLFRNVISDPAVPDPIQAQTGCIDGSVTLLGGKLTVTAELDMGVHDTLRDSLGEELEEITWYNPEIGEAVPKVFRVIPGLENYAALLSTEVGLSGYALTASFMEFAPNYYSAGSPYLEPDRRVGRLTGEKQFTDQVMTSARIEYERRRLSNEFDLTTGQSSPTDRGTVSLIGEYALGGPRPTFGAEYTFVFEGSRERERYREVVMPEAAEEEPDTIDRYAAADARKMDNLAGLEVKQRFENGIDYSLKYRFLHRNELTDYVVDENEDLDDGVQHQISGRLGFKIRKIIQNKSTFRVALKQENRDSLEGLNYKFSNQLRLNVLPRKLSLDLRGEYSNRTDSEIDRDLGTREEIETQIYGAEAEAKYTLTSRFSLGARFRYEDSYDEVEGSTDNYDVMIGGISLTYLF